MKKPTVRVGATLGAAVLAASLPAVPVGAEPAQRAVKAAFEVTIKVSTDEVVLGKKVEIRGKVSPKAAGQRVILQKRIDGKRWKNEAGDRLNKQGAYSFVDRPSTVAARTYRVVKPASVRNERGVSPSIEVTVSRWLSLRSVRARDFKFFRFRPVITIDGKEYGRGLIGFGDHPRGFREYVLDGQCRKLRGRFGLDDRSEATASSLIHVLTDDEPVYARSFSFGESEKRTLRIAGATRVRLTHQTSNPASPDPGKQVGARATVADAEMLCSF